MIYDFIIIGAGISGLYTYYLIKQTNPNIKILILESSNRIGGRILKDDKFDLGAKFLHNDFDKFLNKTQINKNTFYLGKLSNKSIDIQNSMKLEDSGSISKNINPKFNYTNEINVKYDFNKFINKLDKVNIKYNTKYFNYIIHDNYITINNKYKTKKIIFALPVNILKNIYNPYKKIFKNWLQSNIITIGLELKNYNYNFNDGFFFNEYFKKTSFYFNKNKKILYINLFDKNKNFSIDNFLNKIYNKFNIYNSIFKFKNWTLDNNFLGGWSIPSISLTKSDIETIEKGFDNKIFYVGDYLGDIKNMGSVTSCLNTSEKLVKKLLY